MPLIFVSREANTAINDLMTEVTRFTDERLTTSELIELGVYLIKNVDTITALEGLAHLISVQEKRPVSVNEVLNASKRTREV
jgi:hypothetical protein